LQTEIKNWKSYSLKLNDISESIHQMIKKLFKTVARFLGHLKQIIERESEDTKLLAIGTLLSNQQWSISSRNINDFEFKIFSAWGDDGIIQYLIKHIQIENKSFIEFGVENYLESTTRFLMMNNNWSGYVIDGSNYNMESLRKRTWFFKYDLRCKTAWIDKDNINSLLAETEFSNVGLLHIDIDGNDYYVLEAIDFSNLNPSILIMEYNSIFGSDRPISVPYRRDFNRTKAHYSNLFFGVSLPALNYLAEKKGYSLVGCSLSGNNAFFVRNDLIREPIYKVDIKTAYKESKFRESRGRSNSLSFFRAEQRLESIKGLEVFNVITGKIERL